LVFRPYAQLFPWICTSQRIRTSTPVSWGFILARHSSLSFGSYRARSALPQKRGCLVNKTTFLWSVTRSLRPTLVNISHRDKGINSVLAFGDRSHNEVQPLPLWLRGGFSHHRLKWHFSPCPITHQHRFCYRLRVFEHPLTCAHAMLLGPCFETWQMAPSFHQPTTCVLSNNKHV